MIPFAVLALIAVGGFFCLHKAWRAEMKNPESREAMERAKEELKQKIKTFRS